MMKRRPDPSSGSVSIIGAERPLTTCSSPTTAGGLASGVYDRPSWYVLASGEAWLVRSGPVCVAAP